MPESVYPLRFQLHSAGGFIWRIYETIYHGRKNIHLNSSVPLSITHMCRIICFQAIFYLVSNTLKDINNTTSQGRPGSNKCPVLSKTYPLIPSVALNILSTTASIMRDAGSRTWTTLSSVAHRSWLILYSGYLWQLKSETVVFAGVLVGCLEAD